MTNEASTTALEPSVADAQCGDLFAILPLVRRQRRGGLSGLLFGDRIAAFFGDAMCIGNVRNKAFLREEHFGPNGRELLARDLGPRSEIPYASIQRITVERPSLRRATCCLRVNAASRRAKIVVPAREIGNVLALLRLRLHDRVTVARFIRLRGWGLNLLIALLLAISGLLIFQVPGSGMSVIILSVLAAILMILQIGDHVPVRLPDEKPRRPKKPGADKSGRAPFRSKFLGWTFKILAAAMLFLLYAAGLLGVGLLSILIAAPALLLLYIGYQLSQSSASYVRAGDARAPILYLRSFADDRTTNLLQQSSLGYWLGVLPSDRLPTPWRYIFLLHPIRILRIFFGIGADTSEEQLSLFFRQQGPFVAIGKPGERFASPGAARMYVTNAEWQQTVLDLAEKSQLVVLQPSGTEGVWWEVQQALERLPRKKILFCMLNFYDRPNDYETFSQRVQQHTGQLLPQSLPFLPRPAFASWRDDGSVWLQEVSYRSPLKWPLVGNPVDLKYTLRSYLDSLNGGQSPVSRPPKRHFGQSAAAVCLYVLLLPLLPTLAVGVPAAVNAARREQWINEHAGVAQPSKKPGGGADSPARMNALSQWIADHPRDGFALVKRGRLFFDAKKWEEARRDFTAALEIMPNDYDCLLLRGRCYSELGQYELAIADSRRAIQAAPKIPVNYNNLGMALHNQGKDQEAIEQFNKAIALDDKAELFPANRGIAYQALGKYAEAVKDYTKAIDLKSPDLAELCYLRGQCLVELGDLKNALINFNTMIQLKPTFAPAYLSRGALFATAKLPERAIKDFDKYIELAPSKVVGYRARGNTHYEAGNYQKAIDDYSHAIKLQANDAVALNNRASALAELGQWPEAVADYTRVSQLDPKDLDAKLFVFVLNNWLGRQEAARDAARNMAADMLLPKSQLAASSNVWLELIGLDADIEWTALVPVAEANAKANPQRLDFALISGGIRYRLGQDSQAESDLQTARRLAKGQPSAFMDLFSGLNSARLKNSEDAERSLDSAKTFIAANVPEAATPGKPRPAEPWFRRLALRRLLAELTQSVDVPATKSP